MFSSTPSGIAQVALAIMPPMRWVSLAVIWLSAPLAIRMALCSLVIAPSELPLAKLAPPLLRTISRRSKLIGNRHDFQRIPQRLKPLIKRIQIVFHYFRIGSNIFIGHIEAYRDFKVGIPSIRGTEWAGVKNAILPLANLGEILLRVLFRRAGIATTTIYRADTIELLFPFIENLSKLDLRIASPVPVAITQLIFRRPVRDTGAVAFNA